MAVRGTYEAAGTPGEQLENVLHGVWLKHPLHPVFTDAFRRWDAARLIVVL